MSFILSALVVAAAALVFDRVMTGLEARGVVHWRKVKGRGAGGTALMTLQETIEPQAAALVEVQRQDEERRDDEDDNEADDDRRRRP